MNAIITNIEPLYTFDLYGDGITDHKTGENFYLCIITKWTDKSAAAHECGHKSFYFNGAFKDIKSYFEFIRHNDAALKNIYSKKQYTRFYLSRNVDYILKF